MVLLLNIVIYSAVIKVPLVFDSAKYIGNIPELDLGQVGAPRWLANASFALDKQIYGDSVWGYHLTSIAVHILTSCLVFWTVFVTLGFKGISSHLSAQRLPVAAFSAILWSVHPLQTQPVMYTVQRMETLMALFFIAALLMFALALKARFQLPYLVGTALLYIAAVGCKEVAIALPAVLLVYDFVFSQQEPIGNIRQRCLQIFKARAWFYSLLVLLTILLAQPLLQIAQQRPNSLEVSTGEVTQKETTVVEKLTPLNYLTTQPKVIAKYLSLVCLPLGQNFDHGMEVSQGTFDKYFYPGVMLALFIFGVYAAVKRWALGFCIAAFLLILAPTSSLLPMSDLLAEHRMYLPLAFVIVPICTLCFMSISNQRLAIALGMLACVLLTGISAARTQVYRNGKSLWTDSLAKNPDNPRAAARLAASFHEAGDFQKSIKAFERAIELNQSRVRVPTLMTVPEMRSELSEVQNNYAIVLTRKQNYSDAKKLLDSAIENAPHNAAAHSSLGNVYVKLKDTARAIECYQAALEIDPNMASAKQNLALIANGNRSTLPQTEAASR